MPTGSGPIISAVPESRAQEANYEALGLGRLRPRVYRYDDDIRVLHTPRGKLMDPADASPSNPEVISILYETPGVEPQVSFEDFVRGVATVANIVDPAEHQALKAMTLKVAELVISGAEFPALDMEFAKEIVDCQDRLFGNYEAMSWRPLLAFMNGAFWMLSFIEKPTQKRARGHSPLSWVHAVVSNYCALAYVPR